MRFLPLTATIAAFLFSSPASALCTGENGFENLPQTARDAIRSKVDDTPYSEGVIWQARKDNKVRTIVGTIHIYDPRLEAVATQVKSYLQEADLLMLELASEDAADFQMMLVSDPNRMVITDGPGLDERLSEDSWNKLVQTMEALPHLGIPPEALPRVQPWFLGLNLALSPCAFESMMQGQQGLDHQIETIAQELGVERTSLDDPVALLDMFSGDPLDEQVKDFEASILMLDHDPAIIVTLIDTYFQENFMLGWEYGFQAGREKAKELKREDWLEAAIDEMMVTLLDQRNRDWMARILAEDAMEHVVIAVGSAHLPRENGLLSMFEGDGWTLTRISLAGH
ncbi:TraB/GumN family protein [Aliiroseovarius sp. PrR006]|uniref:TraB/GumN family protein n=1 Tax=Aliiroseovarius sp. PrR006 TaxID=2706883 RepID=UPI0013D51A62|nr:TraB/GumN family protein [Aliiroseovarius sp. PrR006]NDW53172.1 TraB/GumN family protein [Aliiroseovarius sp. PrR006]